jgi:transposase
MGRLREDLKLEVVREVLNRRLTEEGASERLGVGRRSVNRYLKRFLEGGAEGLKDKKEK